MSWRLENAELAAVDAAHGLRKIVRLGEANSSRSNEQASERETLPGDANAIAGKWFGSWTALAIDPTGKRAACAFVCGAIRQVAIGALQAALSPSMRLRSLTTETRLMQCGGETARIRPERPPPHRRPGRWAPKRTDRMTDIAKNAHQQTTEATARPKP